jgi:hypothetical protein
VRRIGEVEEEARETERERRGSLDKERRGSLGVTYRQRRISLSFLSSQQPCLSLQCNCIMYLMCCKRKLIWWGGMASVGCLAHFLSMEAFAESFPKGVVNFISGATLSPFPTHPPLANSHAHTHI